ncbi:MAG: LrgB family protein [Hyphomicrobiaceae bacterium]
MADIKTGAMDWIGGAAGCPGPDCGALAAWSDALAHHPAFWIATTLAGYGCGEWMQRRLKGSALVNPVLIALAVVWLMLRLTGSSTETYAEAGAVLTLSLAPITVALAVPTARRFAMTRGSWLAVALGVASGGAVAVVVTWVVASALGASSQILVSLAPRSTTVAVAMEWSRLFGGMVALTALVTTTSAVVGAMIGVELLGLIGIRDERAVGLALGVSSHGLGAARALSISETACAFASIGLAANAIFTSALFAVLAQVPWIGLAP